MKKLFSHLFLFLICFASLSSSNLEKEIDRYSLPADHPFYAKLESIFSSSNTLDNEQNLTKAGFRILEVRDPMFAIAAHPALPGHLVKVHLHSSSRSLPARWRNSVNRCKGAEGLRNLIHKEKLRHFTVPHKWIYTAPTKDKDPVLIVTHMNVLSKNQSRYAWRYFIRHEHLKELYAIISHGYGSSKLPENVPYTIEGKFACIDTERLPCPEHVTKYLSKNMQKYWADLKKKDSSK